MARHTLERRPARLFVGSLLLLAAVLITAALSMLAPEMAPVRQGNSRDFWEVASGVNLPPHDDRVWYGNAYFVDDHWAAYDATHLHGSEIYRVARQDVAADFQACLTALQETADRGNDSPRIAGFIAWRDEESAARTPETLLDFINKARLREYAEENPEYIRYVAADEIQFWERWNRADWYWATLAFEWLFLNGITLMLLWPALRRLPLWRWSLHAALAPPAFLAPVYFGYATFTFTSAGPSGGVLYPYLVWCCRSRMFNRLDDWILHRIPPLLESLSTPIGSPIALTGMGLPGPTIAFAAGLLFGGLVIAVGWSGQSCLRAIKRDGREE